PPRDIHSFPTRRSSDLVIGDKKNVTNRGGSRVDFNITIQEAGTQQQQPAAPVAVSGTGLSMEEVERKATEIAEKKFQQLMDKKEDRKSTRLNSSHVKIS